MAGALDLVHDDPVAGAQGVELLAGDLADDADGEAGAGEGLAEDHLLGQAEGEADLAHLVLEEIAQGLDELEGHVLREAADVVVRLDALRRRALRAVWPLSIDVGVRRALGDEIDAADLVGFGLEDADEGLADDAALLSRGR